MSAADPGALVALARTNALIKELSWLVGQPGIKSLSLHVETVGGQGAHVLAPVVLREMLDLPARLADALEAAQDHSATLTKLLDSVGQNATAQLSAARAEAAALRERAERLETRIASATETAKQVKFRIDGPNPLWHSRSCPCCKARQALIDVLAALAPPGAPPDVLRRRKLRWSVAAMSTDAPRAVDAVTDEQLAEWERLAAAATPGPWIEEPAMPPERADDPGALSKEALSELIWLSEIYKPSGNRIDQMQTALGDALGEIARLADALETSRTLVDNLADRILESSRAEQAARAEAAALRERAEQLVHGLAWYADRSTWTRVDEYDAAGWMFAADEDPWAMAESIIAPQRPRRAEQEDAP